MSDTDLITAGDSAPQTESPSAVPADVPPARESKPEAESQVASGADAGSAGETGLSAMVLPELRALANRVGVKGTSGMRKSELITAIRDRQHGVVADRAAREGFEQLEGRPPCRGRLDNPLAMGLELGGQDRPVPGQGDSGGNPRLQHLQLGLQVLGQGVEES